MEQKTTIEGRYQGAVVGVVVGDILGVPQEGFDMRNPTDEQLNDDSLPTWTREIHKFVRNIHDNHGGLVSNPIESTGFWHKGEYSDDSAQALCVVDSINQLGRFDMDDITDRLVSWYDGGRAKGLGGTTAISLMLAESGVHWSESGTRAANMGEVDYKGKYFTNSFKFSAKPTNGSLMRTAPLGLYFAQKPELIDKAAEKLSKLTHSFDECVQACQAASRFVSQLCLGVSKEDSWQHVLDTHRQIGDESMTQTKKEFAFSGAATTTLGIAVRAFMENDNFEDVIIAAVNPQSWLDIESWGDNYAGPDSDTYGTVAGAFAGAYYGVESIPDRWTDDILQISVDELNKKASTLYAHSLKI